MCVCVCDVFVCVAVQEPLLFKENSARLSGAARFFNASFQVAACTAVGCGPWSPPVLVLPPAGRFQRSKEFQSIHHCPTRGTGLRNVDSLGVVVFLTVLGFSPGAGPAEPSMGGCPDGPSPGHRDGTGAVLPCAPPWQRDKLWVWSPNFSPTISSEVPLGSLTSIRLSVYLQFCL